MYLHTIRAFYFTSERPGTVAIALKHRHLFPTFENGAVAMPNSMVAAVATAVGIPFYCYRCIITNNFLDPLRNYGLEGAQKDAE